VANAVSDANSIQSSVSPQIIEEKDPNYKGPDNISSFSGNAGIELKEGENLAVSGGDVSLNDAPTLAFPSISTSDFQFNLERASDIIVERERVNFNRRVKMEMVQLLIIDHYSVALLNNISLDKFLL
jgi:aprataxin